MFNSITFFDHYDWANLKPLTFTKPISELRLGLLTIREKWERLFSLPFFWDTVDYLKPKYGDNTSEDSLYIRGGCLPTPVLIDEILSLECGASLWFNEEIIAFRGGKFAWERLKSSIYKDVPDARTIDSVVLIRHPWDMLSVNAEQITTDYKLLCENRRGQAISNSNKIIGEFKDSDGLPQVFIEDGVSMEYVTLNVTNGPIYVGRDAEVMEGCMLRGPVGVGPSSKVNMGARIYGGTSIGPACRVGGEVNNVIFTGYSNKGHEGFLGDSVIGEWCNIGADSNNSNLKNDYSEVKLWNYATERFLRTGRQFCGLFMGDHSKCGINTMFNTGTVVGVACNIAVSGFPRNFVPSFSLTTSKGICAVNFDMVIRIAERVMQRRHKTLSQEDKDILRAVLSETEKYRIRF